MVSILAIINTAIFIFLALLHFYWAAGGKWAYAGTAPEWLMNFAEQKPTQMVIATIVVGVGLLGFATTTTLLNDRLFGLEIPANLIQKATIIIGLIFLARAIGDFYYCGFFRKIKEGLFAERDRAIYTPLCLYLGLSTLLIAVN